ncbi:ATP-binding protein [Nocardioides marmorisolisilvae]|uniref:ATP-binding protein n=1 Tax=Nocardioides marmorisolisilvae TaxID=1542737 RepID=UPI0016211934|nr:ATP-binding protein [Nocardioides marmorisolisilvae]
MERLGRSLAAPAQRPAPLAALALAATLAAGLLGIAITHHAQVTAAWWPAAGVGVVAMLLVPARIWTPMLLGLTAMYLLANLIGGRPLDSAALLALSDGVETFIVANAIRWRMGRQMRTVSDLGWLLVISAVGAGVAALGIAITAATTLDGPFWHTLGATTSSHWASVIMFAPLGLLPPRRGRLPIGQLVVQGALLLGSVLVAFGPDQRLTVGFAPLPFLIWAGVSFGPRVVAFEQLAVAALVTSATLADWGPFADPDEKGSQLAQLYLICLALTGLPLALAVRQQKLATTAARLEKQRTEAVVESSTTPIVVTDEEGTILSINPATTLLTGFTAEDLVGVPFWAKLLPRQNWEYVQSRYTGQDALAEHGEGVLLTASGGERLVTYSTGVIRNPVRGAYNLVVTINDVTGERASTHLLQHLLRSATTVAIVTTDRTGAITLVNAGAESMLRIPVGTGTEHRFLEFLDPAEVAARMEEYGETDGFAAVVAEVAAEGVSHTSDWTWVVPDGFTVQVSVTTSLVADSAGRPIGYLFVARDVTETRRNQELLQRALDREESVVDNLRALDTAKDDFVSTVSHELRTPLASIIGSTELLEDGLAGELNPQQRQLLEVIDRNSERLLALANDLLLLAAHENTGGNGEAVPVDLRDVVMASYASVAPMLARRDLAVHTDLPTDPVTVLGDAGYLERAITNLLTNAIKFTPDGGRISTHVGLVEYGPQAGTSCFLSITDTGIGIPADELENVFVRFFRSSNVRADAIQGTGLGLAIVRSIVESHRGRIDVQSDPGQGTTFTVTLPLA